MVSTKQRNWDFGMMHGKPYYRGTLLLVGLISCFSSSLAQTCNETLPTPLPTAIQSAKDSIITTASANVNQWGDPTIDLALREQAMILRDWFINNRPINEVNLTKGSWRGIWYSQPNIIPEFGPLQLDRLNNYQIIQDEYHWNIARYTINFFSLFSLFSFSSFVGGTYVISSPVDLDTNCGEPVLNVFELNTFRNLFRFGWISVTEPLVNIADSINDGTLPFTFPFPILSENISPLWNMYADEDVRVALDNNDFLYVLVRDDFAS